MKPVQFLARLVFLILVTLLAVIILIRVVQRLPGIIVALSAIALLLFGIAYFRGGLAAIGIHSRKAAALAILASAILLILSTAILINVQ